jgi:hypothetical protein
VLHKTLQVRLYPSKQQQTQLAQTFGSARWWWNYALNKSIEVYKQTGKGLAQVALNALLPKSQCVAGVSPSRATGVGAASPEETPVRAEGSAVSAVGGEVRPKMGRKSRLRHSPLSTEAQPTLRERQSRTSEAKVG